MDRCTTGSNGAGRALNPFPPHRRGWTAAYHGQLAKLWLSGFPRTGGDGPGYAKKGRSAYVSPAQAGMDPSAT